MAADAARTWVTADSGSAISTRGRCWTVSSSSSPGVIDASASPISSPDPISTAMERRSPSTCCGSPVTAREPNASRLTRSWRPSRSPMVTRPAMTEGRSAAGMGASGSYNVRHAQPPGTASHGGGASGTGRSHRTSMPESSLNSTATGVASKYRPASCSPSRDSSWPTQRTSGTSAAATSERSASLTPPRRREPPRRR